MNRDERPDGAKIDAARLQQSLDIGKQWTRESAHAQLGWHERRFRAAVAELRKQGYPVISISEQGNVYRRAHSSSEVDAFVERELVSRTRKLEEQIREMRRARDEHFGTPQLPLALG